MPALFSYSNICPDLHLSTLSQGCVMRTTVFVSTLTSIWLFMELSRRMGKLASRLVRLKGWALAKKEKPLTLPGPHRVAQGLRESLARIIQINVYHWARQEEAMKPVHTVSQTGRCPLASLLPARWRPLLSFAFLHNKKYLGDKYIPQQGICSLKCEYICLTLIKSIGVPGWIQPSCLRTGPGRFTLPLNQKWLHSTANSTAVTLNK